MSTKILQKSKVSVNDVESSEEEINSNSEEDQNVDEYDINTKTLSEESEPMDSEDDNSDTINSGWADAISKVLSVKPKKKSLILSKAKKDRDIKRKSEDQSDDLELVKSDGTVAQINDKSNKKLKTDKSGKKKKKLSKNEWEVMHKLKPKEADKERERQLCSIATKGVVQLFNAVREQQKTIETKIKEVGVSETKRDKMLSQFNKNQFLDKLKTMDKSKKVLIQIL